MQKVIKLANIIPDKNQPRKDFNVQKLGRLIKSIERFGLKTPLLVQDMGTDKYLLIDGERRYRACLELGIKEVKAEIEEKKLSDLDRTVMQFHVQEMNEGWSPTEKAMVIYDLSQKMNIEIKQLGELLGVQEDTLGHYMAFAKLKSKKEFMNSQITIPFARSIIALTNKTKELYTKNQKEEFTPSMVSKLEKAVINRIKSGDIEKPFDVLKMKDSFTQDPKMIDKVLNDSKQTTTEMFIQSDAELMRAVRQVVNVCQFQVTNVRNITNNLAKINTDNVPELLPSAKRLQLALTKLIDKLAE